MKRGIEQKMQKYLGSVSKGEMGRGAQEDPDWPKGLVLVANEGTGLDFPLGQHQHRHWSSLAFLHKPKWTTENIDCQATSKGINAEGRTGCGYVGVAVATFIADPNRSPIAGQKGSLSDELWHCLSWAKACSLKKKILHPTLLLSAAKANQSIKRLSYMFGMNQMARSKSLGGR